MAPKTVQTTITALMLSLNLLLFTSVTSTYVVPSHPPPPQSSTTPSPSPPSSTTPPSPPPPPPATGSNSGTTTTTCPLNAVSLGVCANLMGDLLSILAGSKSGSGSCCSLMSGLLDLEAAVCLCLAIDVSLLGIVKLDVPLAMTLLLSTCNVKAPSGFHCPATT